MKTVTYNPLTHKIVPINPTYEMVTAWHDSVFNYEDDDENVAKSISNVIASAPEYQAIEQIPVAIIGNDFQLLYAEIGSISEIVKHHKLKVGTLLYAIPPAPEGDKPCNTI